MISALSGAVLPLVYFTVTVITAVSIMTNGSIAVGVSALAASAFSYVGVAGFTGNFMERREKHYRTIDLVVFGAVWMIVVAAAFGLAYWSDFQIGFFGYSIDGLYWVLLGAAVPLLMVSPSAVLRGWTPEQRPAPPMISVLLQAIFSRGIPILIYTTLSLIAAISIMIKGSFVVGIGVLVACAFSFFGTATFVGSFLARKEKAYTMIDLMGIGSIAAILVAVSFMLAYWTGFRVIFEGWMVDGFYWLLIGMLTALLITRKQDAL
jgi:hypothetical protein